MKRCKNKLPLGIMLGMLGVTSCTEAIDLGLRHDDSSLNTAVELHAWCDVLNNPRMKMTEVRTESVTMDLRMSLSRPFDAVADFNVVPDVSEGLVKNYNDLHESNFPALPLTSVKLEDDGDISIAPGDRNSYVFSLTISPEGLEEGTYLLPVRIFAETDGIAVYEKDSVKYFLLKMSGELPSTAKESGIVSIAYIEVNGFNPLNAGEWTLATSGKQFFDIVNIFAANIKFDDKTGRVYLSLNKNVQGLLDNRDRYVKPLQDKGMKVCLTVLPDHDGVGFANLTDEDIRSFAAEIKSVVTAYGLDGVDFDDEYAEYSSHDLPGFISPANSLPYSKLCYEVKRIMPDKLCTVYFIGSATEGFLTDIEGMEPGDFIDYSYYAQYGSWSEAYTMIKGMRKEQWGPYSWDMNDYGEEWMMTDRVKSDGYGVQVCYDLRAANDPNVSAGKYQYTLNVISRDIYGEDVVHSGKNHTKDW